MGEQQLLPEKEYYPINKDEKGLVLVFAITRDRSGSVTDIDKLEATFGRLNCDVQVFRDDVIDFTSETIDDEILKLENVDRDESYNYLLVVISGHGKRDGEESFLTINRENKRPGRINSYTVDNVPLKELESFIKGNRSNIHSIQ